jgi:hypothetical protein
MTRDGIESLYLEAAWARARAPEAVSVEVDLRSAPDQSAEMAGLVGRLLAADDYPWARLGEVLHVEDLGGGLFEVAVALRPRSFREVIVR